MVSAAGNSSTPPKAVLVTGCSSGIGRATAIYLAQHGFVTFASVRKAEQADSLRQLKEPNLVPVCPLDLAKPDEIASAVEWIKNELASRQIRGLYAIVNNAGAGDVAPIELMDVNRFRTEVETRLVAPVELLQGLLPSIREAQGRIIWIVTPSLIPIPFVSSIHACDFAANCLARTLQTELKPWHIPVVQIPCGGVRTAAPDKSARDLEEAFRQWPRERFALYEAALKKEQAELSAFDQKRTEPEKIAAVVFTALTVAKPWRRYQIGYMSGVAAGLEYMPQPFVDMIMERRG